MDVELTNCGFVQPFVPAVIMNVDTLHFLVPRNATYTYLSVPADTPMTTLVIKPAPVNIKWVEVWLDGFRVFNPSLDFGVTHTVYEVFGNIIQFKEPITGQVKIICDSGFYSELGDEYYVVPVTVQGASAVNTNAGTVTAGYFCEPLILTQPVNGYARLGDDFKSIIYVPNLDYAGNDSFSYSVYTDRGQIATPKCVQITVTDPDAKTTTPTDPTDPTDPTTPPIDTGNTGD